MPEEFDGEVSRFISTLPAYNAAAVKAVEDRSPEEMETLHKVIGQGQVVKRRLENYVRSSGKESLASSLHGTPTKGKRMAIGDKPVTKTDLARLERMVDDLGGIIERTSQNAFDAAR